MVLQPGNEVVLQATPDIHHQAVGPVAPDTPLAFCAACAGFDDAVIDKGPLRRKIVYKGIFILQVGP